MIVLSDLSKVMAGRTLFQDVNLTFHPGHRYGLTGPNGCGKSTLIRMLTDEEEVSTGTISRPNRLGVLRQDIEHFLDQTVINTVIQGNSRLWAALEERDRLYEQEITDEIGMRLGELEGIIAEEDGYSAEASAATLLEGIGIAESEHDKPMKSIPNDHQFRALLCQALFGEPQALLLDEPTNHLDLDSISWLENFLKDYTGTLVVISHDKHFLNSITTDIADIDYETIILYPGNYDDMLVAKTSVRSRVESEHKAREQKIQKLKEFVQKFGAGSRASQVQSRVKEMKKLEPGALKQSNIQRPYIRFNPPGKQPSQVLIQAEGITKGYDDLPVIKNFSLEIARGDKIGIIGNNGRGKTTLVKLLAGILEPDEGSLRIGQNIHQQYFPQVHTDVIDKDGKDGQMQAVEWLERKNPQRYEQEIRGALGKLLFSGDDAFKNVGTLSGGETARLLLAHMMLNEDNFFILDEPNNHLDLESVSALSWGLEDYNGTLVVVSHDRDLIQSVANKIIAFEEDGIVIYPGSLEEYLSKKNKNG